MQRHQQTQKVKVEPVNIHVLDSYYPDNPLDQCDVVAQYPWMERSFAREIESLKLGDGETFYGEGILAVTKALLQSGVTYVGGYQGSPVSHLLDVMVQARADLEVLGVHVEACTNEASAAAMLSASIMYPVRGAVTWKSIVGTNVAADALSNLASPGVLGGALIVVGEDYGEGASVIQERTHAFAMKSSIWLLDPRPNLPKIVQLVEEGFLLSEASNTPVMMELRIRTCHLQGSFIAKQNRAPAISGLRLQHEPPAFSYDRLAHPPATYRHEKLKYEQRLPAARQAIIARGLNEQLGPAPDPSKPGLIVQGGIYNALIRALQLIGLADRQGQPRLAVLVLNVVYPLVPEQLCDFCRRSQSVLLVEEGQPDFIEQELSAHLRRAAVATPLHGKNILPMGGELTTEILVQALSQFLRESEPGAAREALRYTETISGIRAAASSTLGQAIPARPPNFCTGCPERPVFSALKLVEREVGRVHISADIGCHSFATFAPFSFGHSILGYGMSLASSAGVKNFSARRPIAIMGDGGFWHNGLLSGVTSTLLNQGDGVLIVMKNGYTSATGTQELVSSPSPQSKQVAQGASATGQQLTIENTLQGMGVQWMRTVHNYRVAQVQETIKQALSSEHPGLKVIIAEGECQLERQRRIKPLVAAKRQAGHRVERVRFGVDDSTCTGDHSCIRLSGCPSLTIKPSADPLKTEPVAAVNDDCVGCGLCGELAHAAALCPSFYELKVISNPRWWERLKARVAALVLPGAPAS
jgi:indolepyruvate ferredoxin oxidoreductase alpha subunit